MSRSPIRLHSDYILAYKHHIAKRAHHVGHKYKSINPYHDILQAKRDVSMMSELRSLCKTHTGARQMSDDEVIRCVSDLVQSGHYVFDKSLEVVSSITRKQMSLAFPKADLEYLGRVSDELNRNLIGFGLENALRKAHFFAQLREESGETMSRASESLNYPSESLIRQFNYYKKHTNEALSDGRGSDHKANQERIANKAYGGRGGNGDVNSGDGWRYRGRGLIQITMRDTYEYVNKQYHILYPNDPIDLMSNPEMIESFPYSLRSAVSYWNYHKLEHKADRGQRDADVDRITEVINKSTHSYKARRDHFRSFIKIFQ